MNRLLAPAVFGEKRGVEARVKQSSLGILERQGGLHGIVPDASKKPLQAMIRGQVALASSTRMAGGATMG